MSKITTLAEDIDSLGRTANRIADERNALMKLVKRALALTPRDYVGWRVWLDEAHNTIQSLAQDGRLPDAAGNKESNAPTGYPMRDSDW